MLRSKFLGGFPAVLSYIRGCGWGIDWVSTSVLFRCTLAGVCKAGVRAARLPNDLVGADTPGSLGASLNSHPKTQIALEWSIFTRRDRVKIPPVPHNLDTSPCKSAEDASPSDFASAASSDFASASDVSLHAVNTSAVRAGTDDFSSSSAGSSNVPS